MVVLTLSHIKKSFDGKEVLKDINLQVKEGEVVSVLGPSGSGKSTLLRCATYLETADDGLQRRVNLYILQKFYIEDFSSDRDFYEQFEERIQTAVTELKR